jgi:hypothetical protein
MCDVLLPPGVNLTAVKYKYIYTIYVCVCIYIYHIKLIVKLKVKFTLEQATMAQRGNIAISLPFLHCVRKVTVHL